MYWQAKTKDGKIYSEGCVEWSSIKDNVVGLSFVDGVNWQTISLPPNMKEYFQAKTASADLAGKNFAIESRYIQCKIGNNIIRIRVNEFNGNVSVEVE
jgi:hypothetical protein